MFARKTITINWMKPNPPMKAQWLQKVKHIYGMEHMIAQLQLNFPSFKK